jgi:hypothetical protein
MTDWSGSGEAREYFYSFFRDLNSKGKEFQDTTTNFTTIFPTNTITTGVRGGAVG